jgi:hypothetical protein
MIDDRTVDYLLNHIACEVLHLMRSGKTLAEIDEYHLGGLRKKDRVAVYERLVELDFDDQECAAFVAHLRTLKGRKRAPLATVIQLRPGL